MSYSYNSNSSFSFLEPATVSSTVQAFSQARPYLVRLHPPHVLFASSLLFAFCLFLPLSVSVSLSRALSLVLSPSLACQVLFSRHFSASPSLPKPTRASRTLTLAMSCFPCYFFLLGSTDRFLSPLRAPRRWIAFAALEKNRKAGKEKEEKKKKKSSFLSSAITGQGSASCSALASWPNFPSPSLRLVLIRRLVAGQQDD